MSRIAMFGIDVIAAGLLVFALYFPRHRRRDLVAAYLVVNVGVLAVASALSTSRVGTGLGLGLALFGVLSIIRLRSTELDQHEVAYYFSTLAIGLITALGTDVRPVAGLLALILLVVYVGDHPRLFRSYGHQIVVLDAAVTDPVMLTTQLEQLLGARVHAVAVQRVDLVNDATTVEVRFSRGARGPGTGAAGPPPGAGDPVVPVRARSHR
jgi:MFS family permease